MKAYKITFQDGNIIRTMMNASLDEAKAYYIGQAFNFGDTDAHPKDKMVRAIRVEEITEEVL